MSRTTGTSEQERDQEREHEVDHPDDVDDREGDGEDEELVIVVNSASDPSEEEGGMR